MKIAYIFQLFVFAISVKTFRTFLTLKVSFSKALPIQLDRISMNVKKTAGGFIRSISGNSEI